MRTILHDWPNVSALRAAMAPDALLLVNEWIMPEDDGPLFAVWMDMQMMAMLGTRSQWLKLFDDAGVQLRQVYDITLGVPAARAPNLAVSVLDV